MRVLIFLKKWKGGVGVVVRSIKNELEKKGHKVICVSREEDLKFDSSVKNLFQLRKGYNEIIKKENPDIIYTQDWSMALPLLFPYAIHKKEHFCCFHGNQLGKTKFIQRIVGKKMDSHIFVVGDSLKERFLKSNLVYNGVDLEKFRPLNKKRDCLGWINKETEILEEREINKIAKLLKLKPLIAKDFNIPFEKMNRDFYNRCKVFISFPPNTAGFNLCWVEAMAAGVPIIVGNKEGIGWKLNIDNEFKDKGGLIKNIEKTNKKNYRREIEKSDLTWESHVNKLLRVWENV